jgi:hypothetical protein
MLIESRSSVSDLLFFTERILIFLIYRPLIQKIHVMKKTITIICLVSIMVLIVACSKSNDVGTTVDCSGAAKSFATDVNPIIQSYCATNSNCHASGSTNGPGALITYQEIYNARSAIRTAVSNGSMPQNSSLPASQLSAIICWVDNGATNN